MSKAILVMDMPKSCFYCDLCHTRDYNPRHKWDGDKYCGIEDLDVNKYYSAAYDDELIKPDWCPLIEAPEKYDMSVPHDRDYDCEFEYGWNACLEKILGE